MLWNIKDVIMTSIKLLPMNELSFGRLGFMAYKSLKVIRGHIYFYTNDQFYFKRFRFVCVHRLIVYNIPISSNSV